MKKPVIYALLAACSLSLAATAAAAQKVVLGTLLKKEGNATLIIKEHTGSTNKYQLTAKTEKVGGDPELDSIVELYLGTDGKVEKLEWMKQR